jgi:hypothetical protein
MSQMKSAESMGGFTKYRRDLIGISRKVNLQWTLDPVQFAYFRTFYRNWVMLPSDGFPIDLIADTSAFAEYTAQFIPGSVQLVSYTGLTITVRAQLEIVSGPWPGDAPAGCDCSHIAWILYDEGLIIDEDWHIPTLRGTATITEGLLTAHITEIDPLYGISSIELDSQTSGAGTTIELTSPSVFISDAWTLNFSFKADSGFFGDPGYLSVTLWTDAGERFRIEISDDGGGGLNFFYFDASTFNSGSVYGYSIDVVHHIEISAGDGQAHIFIDGVQVFNPDSTAGASVINRVTFFNQVSETESQHMRLDEIRVTNQVEHTADYDVVLPFCICGPEEFPDPWLWFPTTGDIFDETYSRGPNHKMTFQFRPLPTDPEPYVTNVTILDSDGSGSNNDSVLDLIIPLFGSAGVPEEGEYTWEPADPEDAVVPTFTASDPSGGVWVGA